MISDDAPLFHDLLAPRLRARGIEVSQARSVKETNKRLAQGPAPDVIVLDVDFWASDEGSFAGLTAARSIRRRFPEVALLVMSKHDELRIALEIMNIGQQGGRIGYLLKDKLTGVTQLLEYARTVDAGGICIDAELQGLAARGGKLTPTQKKVAELIARGFTNKAIADRLGMSEGTVEGHIRGIRRAYGLPSPEEERELRVNIRVLIVLAYLNDPMGHDDHAPE
ncbi:response regulator transcription factor [Streptomyces sp. NBC_00576]|uniref:response regulator transcription factor n=1 Tax=Streptomyces sp. NBC_00576 TaxID=2903665 RepID=UPI002E807C7D|nr:response regulator transcription factor [Streptomyces sp. NBC_00576]WUB75241.1 response regulator transcription factor [Streptomyces sp. NBC_00576]